MFSFRSLYWGLTVALSLGWLFAAPSAAQAQLGLCGAPMIRDYDNCSPSRYRLLTAAQLMQAQQYHMAVANQVAAYQYQQALMMRQMAMQQQMAFQQGLMLAQMQQMQQLQQLTGGQFAPPANTALVANAPPVNDPALRAFGLVGNAAQPNPAPAVQPAAAGDPAAARPFVVRDVVPNPEARRPALVEPPPPPTKEEEAARKLKFAKMLARDGILDKARLRYTEIAEKYAGTPAALEAEQLLAKK
jgi:TolA-binding protein